MTRRIRKDLTSRRFFVSFFLFCFTYFFWQRRNKVTSARCATYNDCLNAGPVLGQTPSPSRWIRAGEVARLHRRVPVARGYEWRHRRGAFPPNPNLGWLSPDRRPDPLHVYITTHRHTHRQETYTHNRYNIDLSIYNHLKRTISNHKTQRLFLAAGGGCCWSEKFLSVWVSLLLSMSHYS